jgi:hypothetical protein
VVFCRAVFWVPCCWTYICVNAIPKVINKLSHTIFFFVDSSIVVISTDYIELNQKLNSNLHHISKSFKKIQSVWNTNETFIINLTYSKAPIYPLNKTQFDEILAIAETIIFFGLHLDSHLSRTSHENILLKKLSSVYFTMRSSSYILNTDTLRTVYFAHFQPLII